MTRPLPSIGEPGRLPPIPMRSVRLANGLAVTVVERRGLPIVEVEFIVEGGAERDPPELAGLSSMMAEMADEGTAARTSLELAEELDHLGAHFSIAPGWHATTASLHVLTQRLDPALDIVADTLLNAAFPTDEFRRKQEERLSALMQDREEAAMVATKALVAGVFGRSHPFGVPLDGTCASIEKVTSSQVAGLYRERFTPANTHVLVVGDVDTDDMVAKIDARFGMWRGGPLEPGRVPSVSRVADRRILLVDKPHAAQSEVRIGHSAPPRSTSDYFALSVMNTVLGGSFTSRLNTILRERMGVTYGASSRFRLRRNGGLFMAGAAVSSDAAARSAEVVVEEMDRLRSEPVPSEELLRAQSYIALGLPRSFETTSDIMTHVRDQILYGLPADYWQTYVDRVFAVTAEDLLAAAARHLHPEACTIVVVAEQKDVFRGLEQTGLGEVLLTSVPA
jgi:zinc protease